MSFVFFANSNFSISIDWYMERKGQLQKDMAHYDLALVVLCFFSHWAARLVLLSQSWRCRMKHKTLWESPPLSHALLFLLHKNNKPTGSVLSVDQRSPDGLVWKEFFTSRFHNQPLWRPFCSSTLYCTLYLLPSVHPALLFRGESPVMSLCMCHQL